VLKGQKAYGSQPFKYCIAIFLGGIGNMFFEREAKVIRG
jgi:hypothetical protein